MKILKQDLKAGTEISDELAKLLGDELVEEKSKKRWRAKKGETYHYLFSNGETAMGDEMYTKPDDWNYAQNNYSQTKEQILKYREYLKLLGEIRLWREEYNGNWEPDFTKEDEKYYMYYDYNNKKWDWSSSTHYNQINLLSYYKDYNFFDPFMEKFGDRLHLILEFGNK